MPSLLKFSTRDIFWLILFISCNLAWYLAKVKPLQELEKQIMSLQWDLDFQRKQTQIERDSIRKRDELELKELVRNVNIEHEYDYLKSQLTKEQERVFRQWKAERTDRAIEHHIEIGRKQRASE